MAGAGCRLDDTNEAVCVAATPACTSHPDIPRRPSEKGYSFAAAATFDSNEYQ